MGMDAGTGAPGGYISSAQLANTARGMDPTQGAYGAGGPAIQKPGAAPPAPNFSSQLQAGEAPTMGTTPLQQPDNTSAIREMIARLLSRGFR